MVKLFLGTRFSREKFFATTFGGKMKKSIKSIISLALLLTLSVPLLCSCALRLTEAEIKEVLAGGKCEAFLNGDLDGKSHDHCDDCDHCGGCGNDCGSCGGECTGCGGCEH